MQERALIPPPRPGEGVIQFLLEHVHDRAIDGEPYWSLNRWRDVLFQNGLTGKDPLRYEGLAYGNLSLRFRRTGFLISGTQTGGKPQLGAEDYTWVQQWDIEKNRLTAQGPCRPSSEALTHAAAYQSNPEISAVLHVHSPPIWRHAQRLGLFETGPEIGYGTPEMAEAIMAWVRNRPLALIAMRGHEDGIIATGPSLDAAGNLLLDALKAAESAAPIP